MRTITGGTIASTSTRKGQGRLKGGDEEVNRQEDQEEPVSGELGFHVRNTPMRSPMTIAVTKLKTCRITVKRRPK